MRSPWLRISPRPRPTCGCPANTVGIPGGLFQGNGYFSPRVGLAWTLRNGTVLRGAYGIFTSSFQGNIAASSIIGPPYWSYETPSFSKQSMQKWETAFPLVPNTFSPPGVAAPAWNAKSQKTHEWNLAVEQTLPLASTLTLSYVGNHVFDGLSGQSYDDVPAGQYSDLQAARPIPGLSSVVLFQNMGDSWYNGLQAKWERRFTNGLTFTGSYAFSKLMVDNLASCVYCTVQPWTPKGYNRGRSVQRHHPHTYGELRLRSSRGPRPKVLQRHEPRGRPAAWLAGN